MSLAQRIDFSDRAVVSLTPSRRLVRAPRAARPQALRVIRPQVADHEAEAIAYDDSGLVVSPAVAALEAGAHIWVEMPLEGGPLRLLGEVLGTNELGTHVRVKHLWPKDRERYARLATA